jgi:phosphoenolpyruvate phosphomutase
MDAADAHGEYTGIAKFSSTGASLLTEHFNRCREQYAGKPFREAKVFEKSYKILLFQEMLEAGVAMHHTDTVGEYIEIDTQEDFELAQTQWKG